MSSKLQHIVELYRKYRTSLASEAEIDAFLDYLKNPENLEILKGEMKEGWDAELAKQGHSPLTWESIEIEIRRRKAKERQLDLQRKTNRYWWATAASLLVIIGLSIGIYTMNVPGDFMVYTTGFGEVEKIELDDGSQVTLNANSELRWKRNWEKDGDRLAILQGEAFFDVTTIQDEKSMGKTGFDVQTDDLTIQVVGTAFNVKSRTEKTDIFLKEGKILLDLKEAINEDKPEKKQELVAMEPGQSVSYSASTQKLEKSESDQYGNASWMVGTFMYSNKSVREILQSLQEIYGVEFEVEDSSILDRQLTTNLPYSDWSIVESGLELILQTQLESKGDQTIIIRKE